MGLEPNSHPLPGEPGNTEEAFNWAVSRLTEGREYENRAAYLGGRLVGNLGGLDGNGFRILRDRYLNPGEDTLGMFDRVAGALALGESSPEDSGIWHEQFLREMSTGRYCPSSPTLFNAGKRNPQLSSCFVTHVEDSLEGLMTGFHDVARMAHSGGGVGTSYSKIRSNGSFIQSTGGKSSGLIPWLNITDAIAVAVNQGGKRKGAHCIYIEPWHGDLFDFLDLRKNVGDDRRRTPDLHTALWVPDLFMERVCCDGDWTLFSPSDTPELTEIWGEKFKAKYQEYEANPDTPKQVHKARDIWRSILNRLFETGYPWITFKDRFNEKNPETGTIIRSSNLCTEIGLPVSTEEHAVCNLGSINLSKFGPSLDRMADTVRVAARALDNVVTVSYSPTKEARRFQARRRAVGLGLMGFHSWLQKQRIPYDSAQALRQAEEVSHVFQCLVSESQTLLSEERGNYPAWESGRYAEQGTPRRNSFATAIAPTATISEIWGCSPALEPLYSNLYTVSSLSGESCRINWQCVDDIMAATGKSERYVLQDLQASEGSVRAMGIPKELKDLYKTALEIDQGSIIRIVSKFTPRIDQGISMNLFVPKGISGKELSALYMDAWNLGLKSTYYLRTEAATRVAQTCQRPLDGGTCESCD